MAAGVAVESPLSITPFDRGFGAEVRGIDVARLSDAEFARIKAAFLEHMVLVFRDQDLAEADQVGFGRRFGELNLFPVADVRSQRHPELVVYSNLDGKGDPTGFHPNSASMIWHTDSSWQARPALATLLFGKVLPREGGNTDFADMRAAYAALPPAMKAKVASLRGVHDVGKARTANGMGVTAAQRAETPPVDHPVVRTHPETGRKSLYIGKTISHFLGMPVEEGEALRDELLAFATAGPFVYSHRWRTGDLVIWDNRCLMHRATPYDYAGDRRIVHRVVVKGDVPV